MIACSDMTLLSRFYGAENGLNLQSDKHNVLEHILEGAARIDAKESVFYLWSYYKKTPRFYILCDDQILLSHVSLWLSSALGTARSNAVRLQVRSDVRYEQVLYERYPHGVLCIEQLPPEGIEYRDLGEAVSSSSTDLVKHDKDFIEARIKQTLLRCKLRPNLKMNTKRPLGRLLRDFLLACNSNDVPRAQSAYWEICERQLLEQRNLLALELQIYAANAEWARIIEHRDLSWVLKGVISKRVTELLLEAFANLSQIDIEKIDQNNWVLVKEKVQDFQGFFSRKPNLPNAVGSKRYWQYWAILASILGYEIEQHLPSWIDRDWVRELELLCKSRNDGASEDLAVVESSQLTKLLELPKNLSNAMTVIEYASRCYEFELPSLLAWLFSLPQEYRDTLSRHPLLSSRWASWQLLYLDSSNGNTNAESFWCDWFDGKNTQFWFDEDVAREQIATGINFDLIANAIRHSKRPELTVDRLPIFLSWMVEQGATGNPQLWLLLAQLITSGENVSWGDNVLLEKVENLFCQTDPTHHERLAMIKVLENKP